MKHFFIFFGLSLASLGAFAGPCEQLAALDESEIPTETTALNMRNAQVEALSGACERQRTAERERTGEQQRVTAEQQQNESQINSLSSQAPNQRCQQIETMKNNPTLAPSIPQELIQKCEALKGLVRQTKSGDHGNPFAQVSPRDTLHKSIDGQIECRMLANYTVDYDACVKATKMYDAVIVAEKAMDMEQQVRTQMKGQKEQQEAAARAAQGDLQAAALDGQSDMQSHMKAINTEKMVAYGAAVGALFSAHGGFPSKKKAAQMCSGTGASTAATCEAVMRESGNAIIANENAKGALQIKMAEFSAKALAAGIAMSQNQKAINAIADIKTQTPEEADDLMLERCQFNPADPACLTAGTRTPGQSFSGGEFSLGGPGGNNAFNLGAEDGSFGEEGAATNIDDSNEVASLNNPFADRAEKAKDILNPAAAAQAQATGGTGGGGAGGGGGGLGGGGASLGSDLNGADKSGDKEAQIKAGKVSGIYGQVGGGGFKGVSRGKDDANPFASLFDQKGAGGGVVEDRSIASGDIDGKASGLFQKISKRYNQISNDKRIEAKNLE